MLQEIINRLAEPGKNAYRKIQDLLYEATFGLALEYRKKTLDLARITAINYYVRGIKVLREAAIALFLVTLASVVFAVAVVVVPVALVLISPWTVTWKWIAVSVLGMADIAAAVFYLANLFSEERWMRFTKSQEFIDQITKL